MSCTGKHGGGRSAGQLGTVTHYRIGSDTTPGTRDHVLQIPAIRPGVLHYRSQCCKYCNVCIIYASYRENDGTCF